MKGLTSGSVVHVNSSMQKSSSIASSHCSRQLRNTSNTSGSLGFMNVKYSYSQRLIPQHLDQLKSFDCEPLSCLRGKYLRLIVCKSNGASRIDATRDQSSENARADSRGNTPDAENSSVLKRSPSKKSYFASSTAEVTEGAQLESSPSVATGFTLDPLKLLRRLSDWADEKQEKEMHKRRSFYSHKDWLIHRSSRRHAKHFLSSLNSRVIISLLPPVSTLTTFSAVVALYNSLIVSHVLPSFIPLLHGSPLPYELTAPALALLLVFRTEASYSRYSEARKIWTEVISSSKDFTRQASAWIRHPSDSRQKALLLQYVLAFLVALKCHLLYDSDMAAELEDLLDEEDVELVMSAEHPPNCLIQLITESLTRVQVNDNQRGLLDANITQLNTSVSICERLIRTPIPLSYTRLTSRFLVLWHLGLPVVLWDQCSWMVVPATFFSAASLFCIEEVGVLIEEPFPMLALDRMCAKANDNIRELVGLQVRTNDHLQMKAERSKSNGSVS